MITPGRGWQIIAGLCLSTGFLLLSRIYVVVNPHLADIGDLWFGTDIPRHIDWAVGASVDRAHLHPLSFALYKIFGAFLRLLGLRAPPIAFVACAALPAAAASFALVSAAPVFSAPGRGQTAHAAFNVAAALIVGSLLVFAPIPESHTLGGAALLLEAGCVYTLLELPLDAPAEKHLMRTVFFAAAAVGMTITNALPATCLLLPLLASGMHRRALAKWLLLASLVLICLEVIAVAAEHFGSPTSDYSLSGEEAWMRVPHWRSMRAAVQALFVHNFGIPAMSHPRRGDLFGIPYTLVVPREAPTRLQLGAGGLWIIGLIAWWRQTLQTHLAERQIVFCCLLALAGLLTFSSVYDPFEAYMVSAHAWPFILVPLLVAVKNSLETRRYLPLYCLAACVVLSFAQTLAAFPHLLHLLRGA